MKRLACLACLAGFGIFAACAVSVPDENDAGGPATSDASNSADVQATKKDAASAIDSSVPIGDAGASDATDVFEAGPPPKPIVYMHSPDTLFSFDPTTRALTTIAKFSGCSQSTNPTTALDMAIDSQMNAFVTTVDGLYKLDLTTAECTLVLEGGYPNSLSFVPAGTVDPQVEALVGYAGASYERIDTTSGNISSIGTLSGGYASSGDIVSVTGGGSFLTVTGNGCGDCLLQVDPSTGDLVQNYGALPHGAVYGLGYWGGALYGFDANGDVFAIGTGGDGGLAVDDIVIDGGTMWYGAGSTTIAPVTGVDGGAISTQ